MPTELFTRVTELARNAQPPLTVVEASETSSFDNMAVELRDGHVLWKVNRERSVIGLMACPEFDRSVWYDADLLKRLFGYHHGTRPEHIGGLPEAHQGLMTKAMDDLGEELQQLRQPVAAAFAERTWDSTRRQLLMLGRQRDAELFDRPQRP